MEKRTGDFKKWLLLIAIAIIGYWTMQNLSTVGNIIGTIWSILFPFILGGCLAFILNIPMTFFEKQLTENKQAKKNKKQKHTSKPSKLVRIVSILFAIIVIVLILTFIFRLIVPELLDIVRLLMDNIPYYVQEVTKLAQSYVPDIQAMIQEQNIDIEGIKKQLIDQIPGLVTSSISIVGSIFSGIATSIIAIVFAIYILIDKEKLQVQLQQVLYAYLPEERAKKVLHIGTVANQTFKNFLTVQCLEATILGTLCVIGMWILQIPYAVPIGILIGVTALIPVVGAFIGGIIGGILILSISPIKVITFVIFLLVLQQVEGNLIYPRVVGNSIGLPGIWVLVAVSVGGSVGGILGMLIGVPIVSVIYTLLRKDVYKKLDEKVEEKETEVDVPL